MRAAAFTATALAAAAALAVALLTLPAAAAGEAVAPFVWIGNVTAVSFVVHVDAGDADARTLLVWMGDNRTDAVSVAAGGVFPAPYERVRVFAVDGLAAGTLYSFGFASNAELGSVTTFPSDAGAEIVLGLSSCQRWTSRSQSWEKLAARLPAATASRAVLFMHAGDLHYKNIAENDSLRYRNAMEEVVRDNRASRIFRRMQVSYIYDDHDSGANGADMSSPSREAALVNYFRMVPHSAANVSAADGLPRSYHAFDVASARFIVSDLRTESSQASGQMMSDQQLTWLLDEFRNASSYSVVVWVSSRPWIGPSNSGEDDWGGVSPGQRRTISNFLAAQDIDNLIQLSGDMHALAVDSGLNSDYSDKDAGAPAGFPVFHSGPLANYGSAKGGPYTEGCHAVRFGANYQYSVLRLYKLGGEKGGPCVSYAGYTAGGDDAVLTFEKCAPLGGVAGVKGGGQGPKCSIKMLPTWAWILIAFLCLFILACCGGFIWCWTRRCRKPREITSE
jgi:phosphodiesterase/alkaline phosphatase D-like protein